MRRLLWILSLVVVAGFAFLLRDEILPSERTPPSAPSPVANPAAAQTPVPDATAEADPLPAERIAAPGRDVVAEGLQRVRVVATLPDGAPAVAAVVRYQTVPRDPRTRHPFHRGPLDLEAALSAAGRAAVADDRGCVAIDVAPATALCVRCGEYYGEAVVSEGAREVPVALQKDVPLRVQVLDSEGRPRKGLRVEAEVQSESRREGTSKYEPRLTITGADGVAVMPHAQVAIALPGPDVVGWRMLLRCKLDPVVERAVTAADVSTEQPLVLRVPAGGAIAVETVGADGGGLWASVTLEDLVSREQRGGDRDDWFRQLPLGRRWTVIASSFGHEVRRELVGPTRVDEVVRTRIELPLRSITVRGRVVRPDGVPVPQADIHFIGPSVRFWRDTEQSRDGSLGDRDRVGDFYFGGVLPADVEEVAGAALQVKREPYCVPSTIALARPLRAGENDLGEVIVSVSTDEVLLASVEVRAGGRNVTSRAWASLCGAGDGQANSVDSFRAEDGDRITFHGPPTSRPLELRASCPGCVWRRVPVRLGEHVVVELEPAASLAVHLLLPGVPTSLWNADLIDVDGQVAGSWFHIEGGFEWRDRPPGRYGLRILVDGQLVHEVRAIDLVAGANVWPAKGPFDLRDRVRAFHVGIAAVDGADVEWPRTYALPVGRSSPPDDFDGRTLRTGSPHWFVPRPQPVDLAVVAPRFVPVCLPAPSADTMVRLDRCTTVLLHTARGEGARTIVRVIEDGVKDPWLRALDEGNQHEPYSTDPEDEPIELWYAPGTVIEVAVERGGVEGAPQRVVIGRETIEITAR